MLNNYLLNFLFYHLVHLAFVWEKRIDRFAALLLILRPPTMPTKFIRRAMCAVRQPWQRAGDYNRVEGVMPQIAAILFGELVLLFIRQFIPTLARRQRMQNLIQAPRFAQATCELAVGDLKTQSRILFLWRRVTAFVIQPAKLD